MIRVKQFDDLCKTIVENLEINAYVLCSTDEQGSKKIKDKPGINLVAVYPNHSFTGEADSYRSLHEMLFYMVTKQKEGASSESEIEQYATTQDAVIELKEFLLGENGYDSRLCQLFPNINITSVNIIPEYNIFGGYLGWSLALEA